MKDPNASQKDQINHLMSCQMCRMIMASLDLHPSNGWDCQLCFDISLELLIDGFKNRNDKIPLFNSTPFINKQYQVDNLGGGFFVPGKSSHSTYTVPGTRSVSFKASAGEQPSKFFLLFKAISNCDCGKGLIFIEFRRFYSDAVLILESLKKFQSNSIPLTHFERAARALQKYCRKTPANIVAKDKLTSCGMNLYNSIYNSSKIGICTKCSNCDVTIDMMKFIENFLQFIISIENGPNIKMTRVIDRNSINYFIDNYCQVQDDKLILNSNQNVIFSKSIFY